MNAKEIVVKCLKHNIPVTGVQHMRDSDEICYEISGFAKCGTVIIYDSLDSVCVLQRYDRSDYINTFEELARIAYYWNKNGSYRGFSIDPDWKNVFQYYGWISN